MAGFTAGAAGGATVAIIIKAYDEFSKTFKEADEATQKLAANGGKLMAWGGAIATAGAAGAYALSNMAISAAEAGDTQDAYNRIVGKDGVQVLNDFKEASMGMLSNTDSMIAINKLVTRGISKKEIPTLTKLAVQLKDAGLATGDVSETLDGLSKSISKGNTKLLAQYGIIINQDEALAKYALSQWKAEAAVRGATVSDDLNSEALKKRISLMTDEEKRTGLQIAILDELKNKSEELPQPAQDYADKLAAVKAGMDDLKIAIGTALLPAFEKIIDVVMNIVNWFNGLTETEKKIIAWASIIGVTLTIFAGILLFLAGTYMTLAAAAIAADVALFPLIVVIGLIIAIIAVLIYIVILLITEWDNIKLAAQALGTTIQNIFTFIGKIVEGVITQLIGYFMMMVGIIDWLKAKWKEGWIMMAISLIDTWNGMISYLQGAVQKAINIMLIPVNKMRAVLKMAPITIDVDFSQAMADTSALQAQLKEVQAVTFESSLAPGLAKVAEGSAKFMDALSAESLAGLKYQNVLDKQSEELAAAKYATAEKPALQSTVDYDTSKSTPGDGTTFNIGNIYSSNPKEMVNALGKMVTNKTSGFSTTT